MSDEKASSKKKESLGWMEWVRGWSSVFGEILFQRITASHLLNPLPPNLRCHWLHQRHWPQLAEAGAHVVMAVGMLIWAQPNRAQKFSEDGYEQHMQVNHLAPALLSVLLLPSLIRGSPSRIINVNSVMHSVGFVDPDDMNVVSGRRKYSSVVGYSSSKLAQMSLPYRRQRQRQHSVSTLVRFVDAGSRV
ncbi:hypothetical protein F2Q70_00033194 [Brassica cretica]|uniref:Uncharacterized protein n=1 Tax=Brassica cretica TaxID=69181 RepID=A0A8S9FPG1_BRACR|nr:hypothetical protein F2Q70_00033194 [Brassica cretica]